MTIRVLHISDSHVKAGTPASPPESLADGVAALRGQTTSETLRAVLRHAETAHGPFGIVLHTGDVVDDAAEASYALAVAALDGVAPAVLVTPGNHDDAAMLGAAVGHDVSGIQVHDEGGWRLVLVNSAHRTIEHGRIGAGLRSELSEALHTQLSVLIALHHPPLSSCGHQDCRLEDGEALMSEIDANPHVRLVVSGHLHDAGDAERGDTTYLLGPSTCIQLVHQHPLQQNNTEATPIGARWLELDSDGSFRTGLVWV